MQTWLAIGRKEIARDDADLGFIESDIDERGGARS
jgi:hypothetical protein